MSVQLDHCTIPSNVINVVINLSASPLTVNTFEEKKCKHQEVQKNENQPVQFVNARALVDCIINILFLFYNKSHMYV